VYKVPGKVAPFGAFAVKLPSCCASRIKKNSSKARNHMILNVTCTSYAGNGMVVKVVLSAASGMK
jgi:hypothetical protein